MHIGFPCRLIAFTCVVLLGSGCGWIADKDRIKIAKLGDESITRGDLFRVLREMPDNERPNIKSKSDYVRVLRGHLDSRIKEPLADRLEDEGVTLISKSTREKARQHFFASHPDEHYELLYTIEDPNAVGMSQIEWESAKEEIELAVDRIVDKMRGDAALAHSAAKAFKEETLTVDEAQYEEEYMLRKTQLNKPEHIRFLGIRFETSMPEAESKAAEVRQRIVNGENFDALVEEFLAKDRRYVLDSDIQRNANAGKFAGFWHEASGSQPNDIMGPVFMPAYEMKRRDRTGRVLTVHVPEAYLTFKILEHAPQQMLTLEEAKPLLLQGLLIANMMKQLREENGVEIYFDKLPDPALYTGRGGGPVRGGQ